MFEAGMLDEKFDFVAAVEGLTVGGVDSVDCCEYRGLQYGAYALHILEFNDPSSAVKLSQVVPLENRSLRSPLVENPSKVICSRFLFLWIATLTEEISSFA